MVNFLNIQWDDKFIYATAEAVEYNNIRRKVKVSLHSEEYDIEGHNNDIIDNIIVKGLWCLKSDFKKRKKLNKNETIAWY